MQLDDLSDDCLMAMLEWLSTEQLVKSRRLNRRFDRLATIKMRLKIKCIRSWKGTRIFSKCPHLGPVSSDQVLVLDPMSKDTIFEDLEDPSKRASFLSLLSKCDGVKSLDFCYCELPEEVLPEVVRLFPELECIKIGTTAVEEDEWGRVLDEVGNRIVHLVKKSWCDDRLYLPEARLLQLVVAKCPNIKQVDWYMEAELTNDLVAAFKTLPKNCWISLYCDCFENFVFEDYVDELFIDELNWSLLGNRVNRLSSLWFDVIYSDLPVGGIEFAGLKKLDFSDYLEYHCGFDCLVASRFPLLEELSFEPGTGLTEDVYDRLFRRMTSVKKLTITNVRVESNDLIAHLPRSAIYLLKHLERIDLEIIYFFDDWQLKEFFKQFEHYVDSIKSLKKLTVTFRDCCMNEEIKEMLKSEVNQLKLKQNCIEVHFVCEN